MPNWKPGPPRRVVRTYGRDSLLALASPLLALLVRAFGLQLRLTPEERVLARMEQDVIAMRRRGYRVVSSEDFEIAPFGAAWHRVTYELVGTGAEPPR